LAVVRRVVMNGRRRILAILIVVALVPLMALAAGCRYVGSGALGLVPSAQDYAAKAGPAVTVDVFRGTPGESWPPQGKLVFWLRARDFPRIRCGGEQQCALKLQRLATSSQQAGNPPFEYRTCEELIDARAPLISWDQPGLELVGMVDHPGGVINALLLVDDTPENRAATWVLTETSLTADEPLRCGKVIVSPP
jgi:hypothetical protein